MFIAFILMIGILPPIFLIASKVEAQQSEVPNGFIGIYSAEDLNNIRNYPSGGSYILMNDIDLTSETAEGGSYFNNGNGWIPIGDENAPFAGVFDGNGHKISGLKISIQSDQRIYAGLFGYAKNAKILNLGMEANKVYTKNSSTSSATGEVYAGGIVGFGYNVTITNSYNSGDITADSIYTGYAGGIAGYVDTPINTFSSISSSYNTGMISAKTAVGGIAGKTYRTNLKDVYNTGEFTTKANNYTGGIVGVLDYSSITNANNKGPIQYWSFGGGIAGNATSSSITDSYNQGSLTSTLSSSIGGGIVGNTYESTINHTYNTGEINSKAEYSKAGGIAGRLNIRSSITDSYNTADISVDSSAGGIVGEFNSTVIKKTYNSGAISGAYAGGMAGWSTSDTTVLDSFNIGSISGLYDGGGIAGHSSQTTIINTYNAGPLVRSSYYGANTGGIAGEFTGTIANSYYLDTVQNGVGSGLQDGTIQRTFEQLKDASTFEGFDFTTTWKVNPGIHYHFPTWGKVPEAETEKSVSISTTTPPAKETYKLGEALDVTGAKITVRTNHGNQFELPVTLEMVSGYYPNEKRTQQIIVTYDGQRSTFNVTVQAVYDVIFRDFAGTIFKTESVIEGRDATPPKNPTRAGHTFLGWDGDYTNVKTNLTINAQYKINSYSVTYKDGGTVLYTEKYNSDAVVTRPAIPDKPGHTFVDWYEDSQFITKYQFFNTLTDDISVYGKFTKNPLPPQNVKATTTGYDEVNVTWDQVSDVDGYEIQRAEDPKGPFNYSYIVDATHKSYDIRFLEPGKTYYFQVRSYRNGEEQSYYSSLTPVVSAVPNLAKVPSIKALLIRYVEKVKLSWDPVEDADGYQVFFASDLKGWYHTADGKTTTETTFMNGYDPYIGHYYYKIRAYRVINGKPFYGPLGDPVTPQPTKFLRFGGANRYEVQEKFNIDIPDHSLDYVIVTSGLKFPDALSSGVLNNKLNSTTLLVQDNESIIEAKINEAERLLKPSGKVLIVGGPGTVSTAIENEFKDHFPVERIGGSDRIAVSVNVADRIDKNPTQIFLTYGLVFSDSLSIVPYATKANIPIILQYGNGLNTQLKQYLQSHPSIKKVTIVSGTGVIPISIENELRSIGVTTVERVAGKNRFDTSLLIAKKYFPKAEDVALSNGFVFADALSGSRYAYKKNMPIILIESNNAIMETREFVKSLYLEDIHIYGGTSTINNWVPNLFQ